MCDRVKENKLKLLFSLIISILVLLVCVQTGFAASDNNRICGHLKLEGSNTAQEGGLSVVINLAGSDGTIVKSTSVIIPENKNYVFYDLSYIPKGKYYVYYEMKFNPKYEPKGYFVFGSDRITGRTVINKPKYPESIYNMQATDADITVLTAKNNRYISGSISVPKADLLGEYDIEVIAFQEETAGNYSKLSSSIVHMDKNQDHVKYNIPVPNVDRNYIVGYKLINYSGIKARKEGYYSSAGTIPPVKGEIPNGKVSGVSSFASNINMTLLGNVIGNATANIISPADNAGFRSSPVQISGTYEDAEDGVTSIWVSVKNETTGNYVGRYSLVNSEGTRELFDIASFSDGKWSYNLSGNLNPGNYTIKVYANDEQQAANPAVGRFRITVRSNATAEITSLGDNAVMKAGPSSISGTAADPDGIEDISAVLITIQGKMDGKAAFLDAETKTWIKAKVPFNKAIFSEGNWSLDLSGVDFPAGIHWIIAYADDGGGLMASDPIEFTVEP
jgi:hypothetical protein